MNLLTQSELYEIVQGYVQQEADLISAAKAAVVEWKYANDQMYGLFPLFAEIGFRGSGAWKPAKRRWLKKEPAGFYYYHGLDAQGRVRIIQRRNGIVTVFVETDAWVDEIMFSGPRTSLQRYVMADGRAVAMYKYNLDPHQYSCETFHYEQDRLIESVEQSWFIKNGSWVQARWTTTCTYEYDDMGVVRAYRDMGERLGGKTQVFARPKSGSLSQRKSPRRPFVAYTIDVPNGSADREQQVYAEAYGLEMNVDDKWPIDIVILAPPDLVRVITSQTKVTSMGTVYAGASSMTSLADLHAVTAANGQWLLLDGENGNVATHTAAILDAGLNVILRVRNPSDLAGALATCPSLTPDRLVVAFRPDGDCSPDVANTAAAKIRLELNSLKCGDSRVVMVSAPNKDQILKYLSTNDIDGMLYEGADFSTVLDVLRVIAINSGEPE